MREEEDSSSSISRIMKSAERMNLSTFTSKFSTMPCGYLMDLSANCREILVGLRSSICNLFIMDRGIKFILAPKSQRAFPTVISPTVQGIWKLPGSFNFLGS
ncbi:hypothetical protein PIB30_090973, partial [Stylosanthes scabra]|nr:hypothetical protein [Stylosanthes scabra]